MSEVNIFKCKVNELKKNYKYINVGNNVRNNGTAKKSMFNIFGTNANTKKKINRLTSDQKNRDNYIHELINLQYTYKYIDAFNDDLKVTCDDIMTRNKKYFDETKKTFKEEYPRYNKDTFICKFIRVGNLIFHYNNLIKSVNVEVNSDVRKIVEDELNAKYKGPGSVINYPNHTTNRISQKRIHNYIQYGKNNKYNLPIRSVPIRHLNNGSLTKYNTLDNASKNKINKENISKIIKMYIMIKFFEAYIKIYELRLVAGIRITNNSRIAGRNIGRVLSIDDFMGNYNDVTSVMIHNHYPYYYGELCDIMDEYHKLNREVSSANSSSSSSASADAVIGLFAALTRV
jgi:hypothetical protein